MALGISTASFTEILSDIGTTVSFQQFNGGLDQFGGTNYSFASGANKTWIFFKRSSKINLIKFGVTEIADAYVVMPVTDSLSYRDRVVYDGEIFEYSPECVSVLRTIGGIELYRYYGLMKVGET